MTVSKIKEYIDNRIKHYVNLELRKMGERGYYPFFKEKIVQELFNIKSMLDELEPKAKWTNNMNGTFTCSRCGAKRPNDNYCGNCGARMNDKLQSEDIELKSIKPFLLFSERKQVADEYEKWLLKTNAQDIGVNFVSYLVSQGWLDNKQILKDLRRN